MQHDDTCTVTAALVTGACSSLKVDKTALTLLSLFKTPFYLGPCARSEFNC